MWWGYIRFERCVDAHSGVKDSGFILVDRAAFRLLSISTECKSLCRILLWPRPRASLPSGGSATRRVSWSRSSGTLKKASWRARARQVPFLRPLWGGLNTRTRPTRAAYTRARVIQGASEPTTNIACRAYSCTARRRCSPTKATKWREASRAVREARLASHDCRGPTPPQPRNTSRAMHANAVAP